MIQDEPSLRVFPSEDKRTAGSVTGEAHGGTVQSSGGFPESINRMEHSEDGAFANATCECL